MKKLVDPNYPRWNAHSRHVTAMLGLKPGEKLPAEGMEARLIQGIKVWVEPIGPALARGRRMTHRVKAECPDCHKVMSAGRLHQHVCKES